MTRLLLRALVPVGAALVAALAWPAAPAQADISGGSDGFTVSVHLSVSSGGGDPVPSGGITISVPAACYWGTDTPVDGSDSAAVWKWFKDTMNDPSMDGSETAPGYFAWPEDSYVEEIAKAEKAGTDYTWYHLHCRDGADAVKSGYTGSRWNPSPQMYGDEIGGKPFPMTYAAFPSAQGPPPPMVDVDDVTKSLWDVASAALDEAVMDRNPTVNKIDDGTLVNIPTWFWVNNPQQALADDGKIDITASIPGTPVRTHLVAETGDVMVSSDAGSTSCDPKQIQQAYSPGTSESDACTIPFERSKPSGWDVRTLINWTAHWQGSDRNGADGGDLPTVTLITDTIVPVFESQALVDDASGRD